MKAETASMGEDKFDLFSTRMFEKFGQYWKDNKDTFTYM